MLARICVSTQSSIVVGKSVRNNSKAALLESSGIGLGNESSRGEVKSTVSESAACRRNSGRKPDKVVMKVVDGFKVFTCFFQERANYFNGVSFTKSHG